MSVVSGYMAYDAAGDATQAQTDATNASLTQQWQMYQQSRTDQMPWLEAGTEALSDLQAEMEAGPGDFSQSEYYQEGLEEEQRALDTYNASRGLYASGSSQKDLQQNALNNMNRNRGNWLNEWITTKLNPNQSLAGLGQTTATNMGGQSIQTGQNMGNTLLNAGNQRASGYINQSNAITNASQNATNFLMSYYGNQGGGGNNLTGPTTWNGMNLA